MKDAYEINDFQEDVINSSHKIPVLADFWADWCQPCKMLTPVLTEIAEDNKERFKLAKINTDKHQKEAAKFGVRSIPSVKLFVDGKVEAEFQGALSKKQVLDFIDKNLPSSDIKELESIKNEMLYGINPTIISRLSVLAEKDELPEAKILLAQLIVNDDVERARELVKAFQEDSPYYHQAVSVKTFTEFIAMQENDFEEANVRDILLKSQSFLKAKDYDQGLEQLIEIIVVNKGYMNEIARKLCVSIFNILGEHHPSTKKYRKLFNRSLY